MGPPQKALDILKNAFSKLKKSTEKRRKALLNCLAKKEKLSEADETWLDNDGNLVDEERVIEALDAASDFERGVERLSDNGKAALYRLRQAAEDNVSKKRKRSDTTPKPKPLHSVATAVASNSADSDKSESQSKSKGKHKPGPKPQKDKPPVFTKKENATLAQRIEILNWYHANGENQSRTARHFDSAYPNLKLKQPIISDWVKNEQKWRTRWESEQATEHNAKRVRQTQHPQVTEMLDLWVSQAMRSGILLTGEVLRQKWAAFADLVGVPEEDRLKLSDGWLGKFKIRNGLREFKRHGDAASSEAKTIEEERKRVQALIEKYGYKLRDIFNMDETGLFYGMPPDRGLSDKKRSGVKGNKVRLTFALTSNADGSVKKEAFIIGKAKKPRAFGGKSGGQLGFYYRNNAKAWMTGALYGEWIKNWDDELRREGRKILLLQDNCTGHIVPEGLTNIHVENFSANLTPHVQPMDAGIIRCFKAHYRARYIQRSINRYDSGITPSEIYDINQLEGMRLAQTAWHEVDASTIRHCWLKAGILPDSAFPTGNLPPPRITISSLLHADDPLQLAERAVESSLDELEQTGVLQHVNRLRLEDLLNPEPERQVVEHATDEEIFHAVMANHAAEEDMEVAGGADDDDDDAEILPRPSRQAALEAVTTLERYVSILEEPYARKLETLLLSFGRQTRFEETRNMVSTLITDHFQSTN